jgi:hypothetical protein
MSDWNIDPWKKTPWWLRLLGYPPLRRFHHTRDSISKMAPVNYYGHWEYSE